MSLLVRDSQSLDAIDQRTIRIHSIGFAPVARLSVISKSINGHRFGLSSSGSYDPDRGPLYVYWDFGDVRSGEQNDSTRTKAAHVFSAAGAYTVMLAITDDEGSTTTRTALIRAQ